MRGGEQGFRSPRRLRGTDQTHQGRVSLPEVDGHCRDDKGVGYGLHGFGRGISLGSPRVHGPNQVSSPGIPDAGGQHNAVGLDRDPGTDAVVLVGEIGGAMEEEASEYAAGMDKPVLAFIAGRASPPGKKMGHAGAIVMGDRGSYASKRAALEASGVRVLDTPSQVGAVMREVLGPPLAG